MAGKISRQYLFLTDDIHNRDTFISVEFKLSGLNFTSTENISYGYDDSELNGVGVCSASLPLGTKWLGQLSFDYNTD